jgi:hypothetical protein
VASSVTDLTDDFSFYMWAPEGAHSQGLCKDKRSCSQTMADLKCGHPRQARNWCLLRVTFVKLIHPADEPSLECVCSLQIIVEEIVMCENLSC